MTATPNPPSDPAGADDAEDDVTVVVERDDDDQTVLVERDGDDQTVVVTPRGEPVEPTSSASQSASHSASNSASKSSSASKFSGSGSASENSSGPMLKPARSRTRTRPELRPAPVPTGFGRQAQEAIGVGVVMAVDAQTAAPMVATSYAIDAGGESTRAPTPEMPSVERSSRRTAVISLAVVAGACVVSLGGLVALIAAFVSNR